MGRDLRNAFDTMPTGSPARTHQLQRVLSLCQLECNVVFSFLRQRGDSDFLFRLASLPACHLPLCRVAMVNAFNS